MSELFPSVFEEVFFWSAVIIAFVVPLVFFGVWTRKGAASVRKTGKDPSTVGNFLLIPVMVIGIVIGYVRVGVLPHWLFYPGLALWILGLGITTWAYRTLGRFFSLTIRIQNGHRVIDKGPYGLIRHPGYAGVFLAFLGLGLAVQSWVSLLVFFLATISALTYRVHVEEGFMIAELGDDYVEYMKKTKRLIPFIW